MSGCGSLASISLQGSRGDGVGGPNVVIRKISPESPFYIPLVLNLLFLLFAGIFYVYNYTDLLPVSEYVKLVGPPPGANS
jgi:hypothetical protein